MIIINSAESGSTPLIDHRIALSSELENHAKSFEVKCNSCSTHLYKSSINQKRYIDSSFSFDYYQEDTSFGGFPDNGKMYCGPVAASNAISFFLITGLLHDSSMYVLSKQHQHTIICKLGSKQYIGTGSQGSSPASICRGVQKYINESGFKSRITYDGWRFVPYEFRSKPIPDLKAIKDTHQNSTVAVLINIGWYSYSEKIKEYIRSGGHWVTLNHFCNKSGRFDSMSVLDPGDPEQEARVLILSPLSNSVLQGSVPGLPKSSSGFYSFNRGRNRYGVIDGVIVIEIFDSEKYSMRHSFISRER